MRFDTLTCILVLFDCFFVPLKIAFGLDFMDQKVRDQLQYLEVAITAIFFIDLILGFFRSYIDEKSGEHITDLKLIAKRYIKFYFWIDLLGCTPFEYFSDVKSLGSISLLKTIRLLRFKKLIVFMIFTRKPIILFQKQGFCVLKMRDEKLF